MNYAHTYHISRMFLVLSFGAVTMKFLHLNIEKISDCRFKSGICGEGYPIYLFCAPLKLWTGGLVSWMQETH